MVSRELRVAHISTTQAHILCAMADGWDLRAARNPQGRVRWTLASRAGIPSTRAIQPKTARVLVDSGWIDCPIEPGTRAIRHFTLTTKGRRLATLAREEGYVSRD